MADDILGLGGPDSTVKNLDVPDTTSPSTEEEKRHRRMREGADEVTPTPSGLPRSGIGSGIDVGGGNDDTDPTR